MAIGRVAEVGAALEKLAVLRPHPLVQRLGARFERADSEVLRRPLPAIATHIVETVAVGRERAGRGEAGKSVRTGIDLREPPLPDVAGLERVIVRMPVP